MATTQQAVRTARKEALQQAQAGDGHVFLIKNRTSATLTLPKVSLDEPPKYTVQPGEIFRGDSYHLKQLGNLVLVVQQVEENSTTAEINPDDLVEQFDPDAGVIRKVPRKSIGAQPVAAAPAKPATAPTKPAPATQTATAPIDDPLADTIKNDE